VNEVAWYGGKAVAAGTGAGNVTKKGDLRQIGSLKANELGIYDMSGNVHEWVWDKYDTTRPGYANSQAGVVETNPTGITGAYNKFVFRGGDSGGPASCMLVNKRFIKDPTFNMCPAGIRLVRTASK
jgi:formylglycine-generating enzyme required for sulfatase activity